MFPLEPQRNVSIAAVRGAVRPSIVKVRKSFYRPSFLGASNKHHLPFIITFAGTQVKIALIETIWSLFIGRNGKFDFLSVEY